MQQIQQLDQEGANFGLSSDSSQNPDNSAKSPEEQKLSDNSLSSSQRSPRRGRNSNPSLEHASPARRRNTDDSLERIPSLNEVNVGAAANRLARPELIAEPVQHNQLIEEEKEKEEEAPLVVNAIAIEKVEEVKHEAVQGIIEEENEDSEDLDITGGIDEGDTVGAHASSVEAKTRFSLTRNLFRYAKPHIEDKIILVSNQKRRQNNS